MELALGSTGSDPVFRDNSIQDVTGGRENSDASDKHGTRPPIPSRSEDEDINGTCSGEPESRDVPACGIPATRPPPAPSIKPQRPHLRPPLISRKSCLKAFPIPSPTLPSSSPNPPSSPSFGCLTPTLASFSDASPRESGSSTPKKCVSWCSEANKGTGYLEEEFIADDWDRTATEPTRTPLSYKDILELKAIQRSLPCAQQLPDPYTGKPASQYLKTVPIALLPLLPDSAPHTPLTTPNLSPNSSTVGTPHGSGGNTPTTPSPEFSQRSTPRSSPDQSTLSSPRNSPRVSPVPSPNRSPNRSPERNAPAQAHAPRISSPLVPSYPQMPGPPMFPPRSSPSNTLSPATARSRPKPTFTFLPLLETPVTSPPASTPVSPFLNAVNLTPQALDAALGNLCSKDKEQFSLNEDDSPPLTPALTVTSLNGDGSEVDTELSDIGEDIPFGVTFKKDEDGSYHNSWRNRDRSRTVKPKKKKNVIYINGEEVDLDGDDGREPSVENSRSPTPSPVEKPLSSTSCSNVIYINGEPCTLDDPSEITPKREATCSSCVSSSSSTRSRSPSPEPGRRQRSPISPFHRAHPNLPRARTPSPGEDSDRKPHSHSPVSPFHRAHPNLSLRGASPCRN